MGGLVTSTYPTLYYWQITVCELVQHDALVAKSNQFKMEVKYTTGEQNELHENTNEIRPMGHLL